MLVFKITKRLLKIVDFTSQESAVFINEKVEVLQKVVPHLICLTHAKRPHVVACEHDGFRVFIGRKILSQSTGRSFSSSMSPSHCTA